MKQIENNSSSSSNEEKGRGCRKIRSLASVPSLKLDESATTYQCPSLSNTTEEPANTVAKQTNFTPEASPSTASNSRASSSAANSFEDMFNNASPPASVRDDFESRNDNAMENGILQESKLITLVVYIKSVGLSIYVLIYFSLTNCKESPLRGKQQTNSYRK